MWQERAPASGRDASRETVPGLLVPSQHNEHHRWGELKTTEMYSLPVLELRNSGLPLASLWWWLVFLGL